MFNLIQQQHVVKIDFVVRKDSPYRRREFARRKRAMLEDQEVYFVAAEDLILSKLAWAKDSRSEMQLNDVRNLLQYVKGLNRNYLSRWAKALGVASLYREVRK